MKKKILIVTSLIAIIIIVIYVLWCNGIIIFNYPSDEEYEIRGIDVSAYQGDIDWNVLSKQGIKFAFIKATEGSSFVDKKFNINYENATKTKLKIGAYHFFSYDSDGNAQADNFIKNVPKIEDMLPPVVDIEFYGDKYINIPDIEKTQKQLQIMLDKLEEHYGKKPIIYATYKSYNLYIANNFKDNHIWIRDVYFKPNLKDNREWTFWQYTDKARLDGYNGKEKRIDINVFNGNMDKFEKLFEEQLEIESNINNKVTTIDIETAFENNENGKKVETLNQEEIYLIFDIIDNANFTKETCDGLPSYYIKYNSENEEGFVSYGLEVYSNEYHITSKDKGEAILTGNPKEQLENIINNNFK